MIENLSIYFNQLYLTDAYKRRGCAWVLLQLWTFSNNLCTQSVVRVGPPLVICNISFRSPWGVKHSKHEKPWRSTQLWKWPTGPVFFSTSMKRDTMLATEVQWTSGFKAGLHLTVNERSRRQYPQATKKRSLKSSCCALHKHFQGTN